MNSLMERWVQTCRYELLDRTLIWNQRHFSHALHEYERFYNSRRPTRQWRTPGHYAHLPPPLTDPTQIPCLDIRRHQRLGGDPQRVPRCRLTCTDEVSGKRAEHRAWPCRSMAPLRVSV